MNNPINRRQFLKNTTVMTAGLATLGSAAALRGADAPAHKIILGVMGTNGRGLDLIRGFSSLPGAEIVYI